MKILCSGNLVRYPLGGFSWHHLQYLVGLKRLGHDVFYFEDQGWPDSCYDPSRNEMASDPSYGVRFLLDLLRPHGLTGHWAYLAEDGTTRGMSREELADVCRDCDVYLNLSNINWIPELEACRLRVLIDTDPVFCQIGGFGMGGPFNRYHRLFTYGENVHRPGSSMPDGGARWLPARQPVVLDLWPVTPGDPSAPFTTVMNWSAYGDRRHPSGDGRVYGQKDREFEPYFDLPRAVGRPMELASSPPADARRRLHDGGWALRDPLAVSSAPDDYQRYLAGSAAEFSVAKHGYVVTQSGWFSDRTAAYLASGRPAVVQNTGFSSFLPCGEGLLAFRTPGEAADMVRRVGEACDYAKHCAAARAIAETYFDARVVLDDLLGKCV